MELTEKQKRFVDEYLIDLNATQAAIRAGYAEKAAYRAGFETLRKPQVAKELEKRIKKRQARTEITQDRVLEELAKIGFADITDFVEIKSAGRTSMVVVKSTDEIDPYKIGAISSIKDGVNGVEVKLNDKLAALDKLGRHLGMWNDRLNLSGEVSLSNPFSELSEEELKKLIKDG